MNGMPNAARRRMSCGLVARGRAAQGGPEGVGLRRLQSSNGIPCTDAGGMNVACLLPIENRVPIRALRDCRGNSNGRLAASGSRLADMFQQRRGRRDIAHAGRCFDIHDRNAAVFNKHGVSR